MYNYMCKTPKGAKSMRNKILSVIALLLVVALSVPILTACDFQGLESVFELLEMPTETDGEDSTKPAPTKRPSKKDDNDDDDEDENEDETVFETGDVSETQRNDEESTPEIEDDDRVEVFPSTVDRQYYDKEFYLSILPDTNPMAYFWVEKSEGDAMSEAIYARQEKVYNYLGVEIVGSSAGNYSTYVGPFKNAVEKRDGSVDCLLSHAQIGVGGFVQGMYLADFNELPGVDLEADYWNTEFMDTLAIDGSRYLGFSDFNILYTYVLAFNKEMMNHYAGDMEKTPYQLVEDYEWTLDIMLDLVKLVSKDATGDGKTADDTYGLTGQQWTPFIGFMHASNINLVEQNEEGDYELAMMNEVNAEKTKLLTEKLKDLSMSQYAFLEYPQGTISPVQVPLTSGRALMQITSTYSLNGLLSYDIDFGVLPYPMFNVSQKEVGYRSLQWGGYICVPSYVNNPKMVGETLEVLSFYSDDVQKVFRQEVLGRPLSEAPEDAKMLDEYIWNNVCIDFGQAYGDITGALYFFPKVTRAEEDGGQPLASYYASIKTSSNKKLKKFISDVRRNKTQLENNESETSTETE